MLRTAGDWFPRLGAAFEHYYHLSMAISFANAAGPSQCFLIGSLLVLVGVALPVVRTKLGKSAGFDGAPTLVELYNEGKGYQGTRIDISYDILLVGALFILLGGAQCHYPHGYLWTIKLGVLWRF